MEVNVKDALEIEDEDVYSEKSQVHRYLQACQFPGSYETYRTPEIKMEKKSELPIKKPNWLMSRLLFSTGLKTFDDQVTKIITCGLVVDDHMSFLNNFLGRRQQAQLLLKETICPMKVLTFSSGIFSVAWSSAMYWFNKGGALLHLLPMTVPITSYVLWRAQEKHKSQSVAACVTRFIQAIDLLLLTVKRSVTLIQENEVFAQAHDRAAKDGLPEVVQRSTNFTASLFVVPSLRKACFERMVEAVNALFEAGQCMADAIPLLDLPMVDEGIKLNFEEVLTGEPLSLVTIKRLRNVLVLQQSDTLLRLALSLCPSIRSDPASSRVDKIFSAIFIATGKLINVDTDIDFQYHIARLLTGSQAEFTPTTSGATTSDVKLADVYSGVASAFKRLQTMFIATRVVKESIESYTFVGDDNRDKVFLNIIEGNLSRLTTEADALLGDFEVTWGVIAKMIERRGQADPVAVPASAPTKCTDESDGGATPQQDDYVIEDEVFELYCEKNGEPDNSVHNDTLYFSMEDASDKEMVKRSATMVKELKCVLKEKAEEWKVREEIALRKRVDVDGPEGPVPHEKSSEHEEIQWGLELETSANEENDANNFPVPPRAEEILFSDAAHEVSCALNANALRNMFPVLEADEEFCCSGEESEDEPW